MEDQVGFHLVENESGECIIRAVSSIPLLLKEDLVVSDINSALKMIEELKASIIKVEYKDSIKYYRK